MNPRAAQTSAPVIDTLAERWSPRAFNADHSFPEGALRGIMEAARWAPSASNTQPWRFIIARRGSESFAKITEALMPGNQIWAGSAAAFIVNIAQTVNAAGEPHVWAEYDLGQAVAHLTVQAHAEGFCTHQMGGFDRDAIRASFGLAPELAPISVLAIGTLGNLDQLPDALRERETAPRQRIDLDDLMLVRD